jgi:hypothetical protein
MLDIYRYQQVAVNQIEAGRPSDCAAAMRKISVAVARAH